MHNVLILILLGIQQYIIQLKKSLFNWALVQTAQQRS